MEENQPHPLVGKLKTSQKKRFDIGWAKTAIDLAKQHVFLRFFEYPAPSKCPKRTKMV